MPKTGSEVEEDGTLCFLDDDDVISLFGVLLFCLWFEFDRPLVLNALCFFCLAGVPVKAEGKENRGAADIEGRGKEKSEEEDDEDDDDGVDVIGGEFADGAEDIDTERRDDGDTGTEIKLDDVKEEDSDREDSEGAKEPSKAVAEEEEELCCVVLGCCCCC